MATYTTNYNLKKPDGAEAISISDLNNNFEKIDIALAKCGLTDLEEIENNITVLLTDTTTLLTDVSTLKTTKLTIYSGTSTPSSSTGSNGDLYIVYEA